MKILFIIPGLAIGGQEKIGMMLTNELMKYHEVITVCFEPENPLQFNYKTPIIRIENKIYKNSLIKALNLLKRAMALRKLKKFFHPDVSISMGETAIVANAFTFTPEYKIAAIHQAIKLLKGRLYKFSYQKHNKIIPVSNGINKELKEIYGIENSDFIHNGFDIDEIISSSQQKLDEKLTPFFNGKVMVHLGRFDFPKGHWHLVVFFVLIKKKISEARLLLMGDYDSENEIFRFCVSYLRLHGLKVAFLQNDENTDFNLTDVLFTGHQINPFQFLKKADVFVFPSIWEGFGNAIVEAMACGLPIVSADCPTGPREILLDEKNDNKYGVLLRPFELNFNQTNHYTTSLHECWAEKIIELLNDKNKMEFYKNQSLKRGMDFTIERSTKKWLDIIEQR
jgi:glycosyltransferase involved in cell wall biosynthesis